MNREYDTEIIIKDFFLCHSTKDKEKYILPFSKELIKAGVSFWFDEIEIMVGDIISRKIEEGLKKSRYILVFLSKHFLESNYASGELYNVLDHELSSGDVKVLPIIIDENNEILDSILQKYPFLKAKKYLKWSQGVNVLVSELKSLIKLGKSKMHKDTNNSTVSEESDALFSELQACNGMLMLLNKMPFVEQLDLSIHHKLPRILMAKYGLCLKERDRGYALQIITEKMINKDKTSENSNFLKRLTDDLNTIRSSISILQLIISDLLQLVENKNKTSVSANEFHELLNKFISLCFALYAIGESPLETHIKKITRDGESLYVEFKSTLVWDLIKGEKSIVMRQAIAKTIVAFLNCKSGTLLIGVDDDGKGIGLDNDLNILKGKDRFQQNFSEIIINMIGVEFAPFIEDEFTEVDGKDVYCVKVEKSDTPAYVTYKSDVKFFIRIGSTTHSLNVKKAIEYFKRRW